MSQLLELHPKNPQRRLIRRAVAAVRAGGVIVYPTDSCYALGCALGDKAAMERIARIRETDKSHHFTLVCRDLSEIAHYARVENWQYRLLKACTPGPYTFILEATREVPRRLQNPKRRTIGIRVPDHPVPQLLLEELAEPLMSSTLLLPGDPYPLTDAREIHDRLRHRVDLVLDGGNCGLEPTTVVDLAGPAPVVVRVGKGAVARLG
jgi:tRNA threonylcarbamoyl adenosine modification protein (Sua5/YciO/YrdC/YwlC family)